MSTPRKAFETKAHAESFGGLIAVYVGGRSATELALAGIEHLVRIERRISRFRPDSELCSLNRDPHEAVPASPLMIDLVEAIRRAGERSAGMVDGTLLDEVEAAGYVNSMGPDAEASPLPRPGQVEPDRADGPVKLPGSWSLLRVDRAAGIVRRPAGVRLDSGGIGKGLAADRVAADLADRPSFCVDVSGDMVVGGTSRLPRTVTVEHPRGDVACELQVVEGGIATSGVTRRTWRDHAGHRRHHLIDPRTGEPADTGVLQATALAPTATEAEVLAKAAVLAGPDRAPEWLPSGGVVIHEDGAVRIVETCGR